jgi:hypothetical protein
MQKSTVLMRNKPIRNNVLICYINGVNTDFYSRSVVSTFETQQSIAFETHKHNQFGSDIVKSTYTFFQEFSNFLSSKVL